MFYPIHLCCLNVIYHFHKDSLLINSSNSVQYCLVIPAYAGLILNLFICFEHTYIFYPVIITKDILATKRNVIRSIDLAFKTLLPVLNLFAEGETGLQVFISLLLIGFACYRDAILFQYLPYYKVNILLICSIFHGVISTFAFMNIVSLIIREFPSILAGLNFYIAVSLVISVFWSKIYKSLMMSRILWVMRAAPDALSPILLIHK